MSDDAIKKFWQGADAVREYFLAEAKKTAKDAVERAMNGRKPPLVSLREIEREIDDSSSGRYIYTRDTTAFAAVFPSEVQDATEDMGCKIDLNDPSGLVEIAFTRMCHAAVEEALSDAGYDSDDDRCDGEEDVEEEDKFDLIPISLDEVTAGDLREEIDGLPAESRAETMAYRIRMFDASGYEDVNAGGTVVWFGMAARAGVCWNADTEWTDADDAADAVRRSLRGDLAP